MVCRDYTKEIGASTGDRKVPLPVALLILAVAAIAAWVFLGRNETSATTRTVNASPLATTAGESGN